MAQQQYQNQEVVSAEVTELRTRDRYPGQRRPFNYVVRLNTRDPETGEPIMVNEYRTYASERQLSSQTVLDRMTRLIEQVIEE